MNPEAVARRARQIAQGLRLESKDDAASILLTAVVEVARRGSNANPRELLNQAISVALRSIALLYPLAPPESDYEAVALAMRDIVAKIEPADLPGVYVAAIEQALGILTPPHRAEITRAIVVDLLRHFPPHFPGNDEIMGATRQLVQAQASMAQPTAMTAAALALAYQLGQLPDPLKTWGEILPLMEQALHARVEVLAQEQADRCGGEVADV